MAVAKGLIGGILGLFGALSLFYSLWLGSTAPAATGSTILYAVYGMASLVVAWLLRDPAPIAAGVWLLAALLLIPIAALAGELAFGLPNPFGD